MPIPRPDGAAATAGAVGCGEDVKKGFVAVGWGVDRPNDDCVCGVDPSEVVSVGAGLSPAVVCCDGASGCCCCDCCGMVDGGRL